MYARYPIYIKANTIGKDHDGMANFARRIKFDSYDTKQQYVHEKSESYYFFVEFEGAENNDMKQL